jgi:hypothetical protein
MKTMNDLIYRCMIEEKKALTNQEIVKRFYKMGPVQPTVARRIVEPLLEQDRRFVSDGSLWKAVKISSIEDLPLWAAPYLLFAIDEIKPQNLDARAGCAVPALFERFASFLLFRGGEAKEPPSPGMMLEESQRYAFLPYDAKSLNRLKRIFKIHSPLPFEAKVLSLRRLLGHFFPDRKYSTWDDIIREFSIVNYEGTGPAAKTRTMALVFDQLLRTAEERGVKSAGELIEVSNRIETSIDFSRYGFDREYLRGLPEKPGVYLFKNREDSLIYVGKTRNIKERVRSYFRQTDESEEKQQLIRQHLYSIQYRELGSDLEALIEEFRLIQGHKPVLNQQISVPERRIPIPKCILVLPSAREGFLKLYFLSEGAPLLEEEYRPGVDISALLRMAREQGEYLFDPLKVIASTYLKRYEEHLNVVVFDLYGTDSDLVVALDSHWRNRQAVHEEKVRYIG